MDIDGAVEHVGFAVPYLGQDFLAREDAAGVPCQQAQYAELLGRELQRLAGCQHEFLFEVDGQGARPEQGAFGFALRAAHHGLHAGEELVEGEGLGHVVIAPGGEAREHVAFGVFGREEDDGYGVVEHFAEVFGKLEARHAAEHHVEQDQAVVRGEQLECFFGTFGGVHLVARIFQVDLQNFPQVGLVVYD